MRNARDLAADAGDVETSMTAINRLAATFNVDAIDMKLTALVRSGKSTSASTGTAIVTAAGGVLESIVASNQFSDLARVSVLAESPAVLRQWRGYCTQFPCQ